MRIYFELISRLSLCVWKIIGVNLGELTTNIKLDNTYYYVGTGKTVIRYLFSITNALTSHTCK